MPLFIKLLPENEAIAISDVNLIESSGAFLFAKPNYRNLVHYFQSHLRGCLVELILQNQCSWSPVLYSDVIKSWNRICSLLFELITVELRLIE
tara:strand:- start:1183 stop:1461 length:279 start_codon:yes stop_codon:yes gene_type:complete